MTVVCYEDNLKELQAIIFKQTTTIGIRYRYEQRTILEREIVDMDTKYGKVKAKKVVFDGETYYYPEYEDLKRISQEKNIPLKNIYQMIK